MSNRAEELAKQLLEKTESGKLLWNVVHETPGELNSANSEKYRTDLEGVFSFSIERTATGDDKVLRFELTSPSGIVFSEHADNLPLSPKLSAILEQGRTILKKFDGIHPGEPTDASKISRFRLFSDLFYAARRSSVDGDQTIEKVQQLLERLG